MVVVISSWILIKAKSIECPSLNLNWLEYKIAPFSVYDLNLLLMVCVWLTWELELLPFPDRIALGVDPRVGRSPQGSSPDPSG